MADDSPRLRAARSIKFGRLERASARFDRERAETVIREWTSNQRCCVVWAEGLTQAVEQAAGRESNRARVPVVRVGWGESRVVLSRHAEYERIREVARLDERLLAAARHKAASRVPAEQRLAFRTSIPRATLVSSLGEDAVLNRSGRVDSKARALSSALSKSGVLAVWFLDRDTVIAVPRPNLTLADGRLHSPRRPAARWVEESLWFWQGVWIPDHLATRRGELGLADVLGERNVERRRILIDVIGFENLVQAATGGVPSQQDDYGRLWRLGNLLDDEEYVAVEVVNSTPDPDGSSRRYFLRVPPATKTARAGVAWTFEMGPREYVLTAQS
jgi:hypothetical protein